MKTASTILSVVCYILLISFECSLINKNTASNLKGSNKNVTDFNFIPTVLACSIQKPVLLVCCKQEN